MQPGNSLMGHSHPHLAEKKSSGTPAQDAAITPSQGEACASLSSLLPFALAVPCSQTDMEELVLLLDWLCLLVLS